MATSKFGKAFAAARKAGKKEFSFGGKSYNTKLRGEGKTPTPTPKPARAQGKASAGGSTGGSAKASVTSVRRSTGVQGPSPSKSVGVREAQDYPRAAKAVGIAKKGSAISKAVARKENKPKKK